MTFRQRTPASATEWSLAYDVRFGSEPDMYSALVDVRFPPKAGMCSALACVR